MLVSAHTHTYTHTHTPVCYRWFDKGEDDGAIERELFPTSGGGDGSSTNWRLVVVTGA